MTLISICIKLYMLNILQYSKLRPLCIAKNQTFPFIIQTSTSTLSTLSTASTTSNTLLPNVTTVTPTPITTASNTIITTSVTAVTNSTVPTTIINTRQRNVQRFGDNGYEYNDPMSSKNSNCPELIDYCAVDGSSPTKNCPCFDLRSGQLESGNISGRSCIGPEKDAGFCTKINDCPFLVEEYYAVLQKRSNISYDEFLILSKCRETADQICCPSRK